MREIDLALRPPPVPAVTIAMLPSPASTGASTPAPAAVFCPSCGARFAEAARFCSGCGASRVAPAVATATPAVPASVAPPSRAGHLRDAASDGSEPVSYMAYVREDHGATPEGDRARRLPAGARVTILAERGDQVRVSYRGWEGWVEASAVERE